MKWPWISRRKHESALKKQAGDLDNKRYDACHELMKSHREELAKTKRVLDDIVPRLFRASVQPHPESFRYALYVEFDSWTIEEAFHHGDSRLAMAMIAENVAHRLEHELLKLNDRRPIKPLPGE